jgi:hypothetical protein
MQDFKFNSYVEFYEYLTDEHKVMVNILKELIQDTIPDIKEKLSWNVPFFYQKKSICFIWPGSIPWGKKTYEGVQLGFAKGYLMKPNNFLEKGDRKQIFIKTFFDISEIEKDVTIITNPLIEADELDN